jgi:transposase
MHEDRNRHSCSSPVRAHLEKAAIVLALLADEDRLHRRLHVMGWTSPAFLPALLGTKEGSMSLELLAIDLGKRSFHYHGIDSDGIVLSRKVSRFRLLDTIKELAPKAVAMEACASAHFWGRSLLADGRRVLLINPWFVKPFVKGSKNDAADAEAIYEAALRPTMRFVPVKSTEQQDLQSLHRARERVVCARTALINHMRGLLGEYGVILPQGAWRFLKQAQDAIAVADLSDLARGLFADLFDELQTLDLRLDNLDQRLLSLCRTNEACRRLSKLPGVGPVIATALVAAVADGRHFRSGRELAAWIGLVPRQYTTGGKPRLGGIGRRANHYLRRQMIHGARAVMFRLTKHEDRRSQWVKGLAARRGFNRAIVALANKTARIAWVVLTRKEDYSAAA